MKKILLLIVILCGLVNQVESQIISLEELEKLITEENANNTIRYLKKLGFEVTSIRPFGKGKDQTYKFELSFNQISQFDNLITVTCIFNTSDISEDLVTNNAKNKQNIIMFSFSEDLREQYIQLKNQIMNNSKPITKTLKNSYYNAEVFCYEKENLGYCLIDEKETRNFTILKYYK